MKVVRRARVPAYQDHSKYKPLLRVDFQYRCAYCQHHERRFAQLASMTVDHFRPKSRFPHLRVNYTNLYYCCGECNTYKADNWPTAEEERTGSRFVDICKEDWDDHLEVVNDVVAGKSRPGEFTVQNIRLYRRELTTRNRELREREGVIREELARIGRIRQGLGAAIDAHTARELDELQRSREADLRLHLSPEPFEE